jgi:hypothetical protein
MFSSSSMTRILAFLSGFIILLASSTDFSTLSLPGQKEAA